MRALLLVSCLSALACGAPSLQRAGGPCRSLTDCERGLACVDGACSADPSALADDSEPPPFVGQRDAGSMDASPFDRDAGDLPDAG